MTFTVIDLGQGGEKVVGTIWASEEAEAQAIFSNLLSVTEKEKVVIRRAEEREIPMKQFE